jgi:hypothetical protein
MRPDCDPSNGGVSSYARSARSPSTGGGALSVWRAWQARPARLKLFSSLRDPPGGGDFLDFQSWSLSLPHKRGQKRFPSSERGWPFYERRFAKNCRESWRFEFGRGLYAEAVTMSCDVYPSLMARRFHNGHSPPRARPLCARSWVRLPEGNRNCILECGLLTGT